MGKPHRTALAAAAWASAACLALAGCGSPALRAGSPVAAAPGVAKGTITIGSFQPLTGPDAPGTSQIAPASAAYFSYVNAHGGVYGRKIIYRYLNDHSDPALAAPITHRLIQQDNLLAIFNPAGTTAHLGVTAFLNSARVPDMLAGSGCPCWNNPTTQPYTYGWQLDYLREGKILGAYIASHYKNQKTAIIYTPGQAGLDGARGAGYEIPRVQITAKTPYPPSSKAARRLAAALKASHATVVMTFTTPAGTAALLLAMAHLHYHPHLAATSTSADPATLDTQIAAASHTLPPGAATALTQGIITDSYLPTASSTTSTWIKLFQAIRDRYLPHVAFSAPVVEGMAAAYVFTQALQHAGPNPTRETLINAINQGLPQGPALAPLGYSPTSHAGATGASIAVIHGTTLTPTGPVMTTNDTPTGPVTPWPTPEPPAPATGLPPP